jgi:hypothetical protein
MLNWIFVSATIAGILGFVLAVGIQIGKMLEKRRERKDENLMGEMYAGFIDAAATSNGNAWTFETGSEGFRLAEKMVARGMLNRLPMGYYTVCGVNLQR